MHSQLRQPLRMFELHLVPAEALLSVALSLAGEVHAVLGGQAQNVLRGVHRFDRRCFDNTMYV